MLKAANWDWNGVCVGQDTGLRRRFRKVLSSQSILQFEIAIVAHRMNEIIGRLDTLQGRRE